MKFYTGKVENRNDPLKLGRCQVRVMGVHTSDTSVLPTTDLPWSHPVNPIASSSSNGTGISSTGVQEGSVVLIWFADGDRQQIPVILGTLPGIPQDDPDNPLSVQQSEISFDPNTQQATIPNVPEPQVTQDPADEPELSTESARPARTFTLSNAGVDLIKGFEGFSATAYLDNTQYSIGYGSGTWRGQPVTQSYPGTVTEAEAAQELRQLAESRFGGAVKNNVRALITQQMYDAMVSLAYNIGTGGFAGSTVVNELNRQQYEASAAAFNLWNKSAGQVLPALVRRRRAEEQFFLSGGIPNGSGETVPAAGYEGNTGNPPVGSTDPTSGAIVGNPTSVQSGNYGANTGVPSYYNEPDTNRLARHEDIDRTSVYQKEASRWRGATRFDGSTWDQPEIPYNADYPFNKVTATESGHVFELDDTPRAERINIYHRVGSYWEIDHNGTQTNRVAGDRYDFSERDHFEAVRGSKVIYVEGEVDVVVKNGAKLNIQGTCDIVVNGDANVKVGGDLTSHVDGDAYTDIVGNHNMSVKGGLRVRAEDIYFEANDSFNINAGGQIKIDGEKIDLANGAPTTGIPTPTGIVDDIETTMPEFAPLIVNSRSARERESYEVPDEGNPEPFRDFNVNRGLYESDQMDRGTVTNQSTPVPNQDAQEPVQSCDVIYNMDTFNDNLQLSNRFQLGAFTKNGTRPPVNQQGLTKQQIVCNLKGLSENILEHVLSLYPNMVITSGFRRPGDVANSSRTSQHYLGQAVDIVLSGYSRQQHFEAAARLVETLPAGFDQVILEYAGARTVWIHLSWKYDGNRRSFFTMRDHRTLAQNFAYVAETA